MNIQNIVYILKENLSLFYFGSFLLGAILSSHIGVLVDRLPHTWRWRDSESGLDEKLTFLEPSHCNHCHAPIGKLALIPIVGWLLTKGRCPHCQGKVSPIYPITEIIIGMLSGLLAWKFGPTYEFVCLEILLLSCFLIAWIDLNEAWIPEEITMPLLIFGLVGNPFEPFALQRSISLAGMFVFLKFINFLFSLKDKDKIFLGRGDFDFLLMSAVWLNGHLIVIDILIFGGIFLLLTLLMKISPKIVWHPKNPAILVFLKEDNYLPLGPCIAISLLICLVWRDSLIALVF